MKKRRNDKFLIAALLLFTLVIFLATAGSKQNGAYAVVKVNGTVFGTYPLSRDAEIPIRNGVHYNLLVIKDGAAYMKEADCKNQICVHQGEIRYAGQSIVCLPNQVTVTITGGAGQKVDAVSG